MKVVKGFVAFALAVILAASAALALGSYAVTEAISEESVEKAIRETDAVGQLTDSIIQDNTVNLGGRYGEIMQTVLKSDAMTDFFTVYTARCLQSQIYGEEMEEVGADDLNMAFSRGMDECIEDGSIDMGEGERKLFDLEHLRIYEGDRIGLVGMNGAGKTTLLRLLSGELQPEEGTVKRFCKPFHFRQFADAGESDASPEALSRMGVNTLQGQETVSGGEAERLRLAEVFSADRAFLLLDEPTSNLDREGIRLLDERLGNVRTLVLISHDRTLLNHQCTRILEIEQGVVREYDGNYDDYVLQKQQARARAMTEYEQYTEEIGRLKKVKKKS